MMENLQMGGYGAYVWSSFALMFTVVIITAVQARIRHQKLMRDIRIRITAMEAQQ